MIETFEDGWLPLRSSVKLLLDVFSIGNLLARVLQLRVSELDVCDAELSSSPVCLQCC